MMRRRGSGWSGIGMHKCHISGLADGVGHIECLELTPPGSTGERDADGSAGASAPAIGVDGIQGATRNARVRLIRQSETVFVSGEYPAGHLRAYCITAQ